LILTLEEAQANGDLYNTEVFVFTDNSMAERAFYNGISSSRTLFNLVLKLQKLQMHQEPMIHFVHVSGRRMMAQGTDGLSRGVSPQGALRGTSLLEFVPLHQDPVERQGIDLKAWVESWFGALGHCWWVTPEDWFEGAHSRDKCVWSLPPDAAQAALEQLSKAIHKWLNHTHVALIPCLMTALWRRLFNKLFDLVFEVPAGTDVWSNSQFEPLIVGIYFPLSRHPPWRLKGTMMLDRVGRLLRGLPTTEVRWGWLVLQQLLEQVSTLE
jgi:hypothetical protein